MTSFNWKKGLKRRVKVEQEQEEKLSEKKNIMRKKRRWRADEWKEK